MFCTNCGTKNSDEARFCTKCGNKLGAAPVTEEGAAFPDPTKQGDADIAAEVVERAAEETSVEAPVAEPVEVKAVEPEPAVAPMPEPVPTPVAAAPQPAPQPTVNIQNNTQVVDPTEKPMTIMGWIGTFLLLLIPIVNIVLPFVWAFSSGTNKSKKSYFQACLILCLIMIILTIVFGSAIAVFVAALVESGDFYY